MTIELTGKFLDTMKSSYPYITHPEIMEHLGEKFDFVFRMETGQEAPQTTEALNPFAKWLNGGEDDNRTPCGSVYIEEAPGGFESVSDLKKEFENYCRLQTPDKTKMPSWEKIYSDPLLKRGFQIERDINMCKSCNKPAKAGCCEEYSPQNRSKRHIVHNIRIVRKTNESNQTTSRPSKRDQRMDEASAQSGPAKSPPPYDSLPPQKAGRTRLVENFSKDGRNTCKPCKRRQQKEKHEADAAAGRFRTICKTCFNGKVYYKAYRERQRAKDLATFLARNAKVAREYRAKHPELMEAYNAQRRNTLEGRLSRIENYARSRGIFFDTSKKPEFLVNMERPCEVCGHDPILYQDVTDPEAVNETAKNLNELQVANGLMRIDHNFGFTVDNTLTANNIANQHANTEIPLKIEIWTEDGWGAGKTRSGFKHIMNLEELPILARLGAASAYW
ncbi:hypothetical protein HK102_008549, partial [Quaeritorhiza haematococci]